MPHRTPRPRAGGGPFDDDRLAAEGRQLTPAPEIENDKIVEKAHYIGPDGNNFWGVQVFEQDGVEYVAASDRDHGLWIFRYND